MDNKTLFWSFYVSFCAFCASFASLCLIKHLFTRPKTSMISVNPVILSIFSSCLRVFCASLRLKNPFNQRNPWLTNDLRTCKALYICRDSSTDIESSLQINSFMQNKANFRKSQMNVTSLITVDYEKRDTWLSGKNEPKRTQNEPKTNPKRTQTNPISKRPKWT